MSKTKNAISLAQQLQMQKLPGQALAMRSLLQRVLERTDPAAPDNPLTAAGLAHAQQLVQETAWLLEPSTPDLFKPRYRPWYSWRLGPIAWSRYRADTVDGGRRLFWNLWLVNA